MSNNTAQLETVINSAIINGNRILEGGIGTVLPTKEDWKIIDKVAKKEVTAKAEIAKTNDLDSLDRQVVAGEVRYYNGENSYAIVSRSMRVLWFTKRNGGWYAA